MPLGGVSRLSSCHLAASSSSGSLESFDLKDMMDDDVCLLVWNP